MSVLMTLRVKANIDALESRAAANPAGMQAIRDQAIGHGLISHRFYGSGDEVLVLDEWESEAGFQSFFAEATEVGEMMREAGVTTEPEIRFWRKLDTHDDYPS